MSNTLRFNIALLPKDPNLQNMLAQIARMYFEKNQDGYILGESALAHVTLCRFHANDEQTAQKTFDTFIDKKDMELALKNFRTRAGENKHKGSFWAEFPVEKKPALLNMQERCAQHLKRMNLETLTPTATYEPHITLARVSRVPPNVPSIKDIEYLNPVAFTPAIGISSENGVFIRTL